MELTRADLTTFCRRDELGLVVTGQRLEPDRAVLACEVLKPDRWCRRCGCARKRSRLGYNPTARSAWTRDGQADRLDQPQRPAALSKVTILGRTLTKLAADVMAYFDRAGTSNGPKAINGQPRTSRRLRARFRSLTNYIARSLLESGAFRPHLHPRL